MNQTVNVSVTPVLTVHATYASGDYVGTSATPMEFAGVATLQQFSGTIIEAMLIDAGLQSVEAELWLFDSTVTPPADSAAWTISDADAAKLVGIFPFSTYYASALNSFSYSSKNHVVFRCAGSGTSLFGCLVVRGAPTWATDLVTIRLTVWQD